MKQLTQSYLFRTVLTLLTALLTGFLWTQTLLAPTGTTFSKHPLPWAILSTLALLLTLYWQQRLFRRHERKVLFLLDAIENNDTSIHFAEDEGGSNARLVNKALNRVANILYKVKSDTAQQEKYYELILECVDTGIIVLNENGAIYQTNGEALRLLGIDIFTHANQLSHIDARLAEQIIHCRAGEKFRTEFSNERGSVTLSVRVSTIAVRGETLRILALNDINNELDEKEIDSWIRLIRVLTHEIMNAVTPITSLSETLLGMATDGSMQTDEEKSAFSNGLQTICTTGKGLLAFVDSYRKLTRIPTPVPSLFYVKEFAKRMIGLARHYEPGVRVNFQADITPPDLILHADEQLVSQVVANLLKNALQAIHSVQTEKSPAGNIRIHAYCTEEESIIIEVSNDGPPISTEVAAHIFIPFFTTKEGGSGIGLSLSRQIMRISGGTLSLLPGRETTFRLRFQ